MTKQMFVVTNESGTIIAASVANHGGRQAPTHIAPRRGQKMYLVSVPEHLADFNNFQSGDEFHEAITNHLRSKDTKHTLVTPSSHPSFFRFNANS